MLRRFPGNTSRVFTVKKRDPPGSLRQSALDRVTRSSRRMSRKTSPVKQAPKIVPVPFDRTVLIEAAPHRKVATSVCVYVCMCVLEGRGGSISQCT